MTPRHLLSPKLDPRLVAYASTSWNAHEAMYAVQQMTSLLPAYRMNLESIFGPSGLGDARRAWGVVADLVAAMTGLDPTHETLCELGFDGVREIDRIIPAPKRFALAASEILTKLDFDSASVVDLTPVLMAADHHDRIAKPMLQELKDELESYDLTALEVSAVQGETLESFRDLVRQIGDQPRDFPMWDERPLFLDEQHAVLDYLAKSAAVEIVAACLIDGTLGEYLLRANGVLQPSEITGEAIFEMNAVPSAVLHRPVELVCHQVGDTVLGALGMFGPEADMLDRLTSVEDTVKEALGIDLGPGLAATRANLLERRRASVDVVIDLRDRRRRKLSFVHPLTDQSGVEPYDFPDLTAD